MWHIVSDTSCDLHSLEGGEGIFDFATIPFTIRIGDKEYIDDEGMRRRTGVRNSLRKGQ